MNRTEHLQWCKDRALEYVAVNDMPGAFASFTSDMGKHQETESHSALELMGMLYFSGNLNTVHEMTKFIHDFN